MNQKSSDGSKKCARGDDDDDERGHRSRGDGNGDGVDNNDGAEDGRNDSERPRVPRPNRVKTPLREGILR